MTLGERLRKAREDLKKKQTDIAAEMKRKQPTVVAWERDQAVPSMRDLRPLDELLDCEIPQKPSPRTKRKTA